jgi:hypothetical protein
MKLTDEERKVLKDKLHEKIGESKIKRGSKRTKDKILEDNFKAIGIDKKRLMEDVNNLQAMGGNLEFTIKQ